MNKTLLVLGHTYPEPTTTAAGTRMIQLINFFRDQKYQITFASTAQISAQSFDFSLVGVTVVPILLNDPSFDSFITALNPAIVLFDRFITEEQFGWRVQEQCPKSLRILDTEDLHFLRKARQLAVKEHIPLAEANLYSETAMREIASMYRCDLSLIISEVEKKLLTESFNLPDALLMYLPFLVAPKSSEEIEKLPKFSERTDFITLGNMLHAPNVDAIIQLKNVIWPQIRKQLPEVKLRVYGAYAPQQIKEFHNEQEGFIIAGWAEDAEQVFSEARVSLAPLRYGAGLKGKLIDAMLAGTPSVSSQVGAEGICGTFKFNGFIEDDPSEFVEKAIQLYSEEKTWKSAQENGFVILENRFRSDEFYPQFDKVIKNLLKNLNLHRKENFIGQMLQHHSMQSTKYLSKWIEQKNTGIV